MSAPVQNPISRFHMSSPVGLLQISHRQGVLMAIDFVTDQAAVPGTEAGHDALRHQLRTYFEEPSHCFRLEFDLRGTPFQQRLWQALLQIAPGQTLSYGDLAKILSSSARAVGNACRANPCPIVVPCHRVLAKQGLGGYAGATGGKNLEIKRWLLRHEGVDID